MIEHTIIKCNLDVIGQCFTYLGGTRLWDKDETIYASCAREMYANHDWVVPVFNGHLFPDKPPLMYWLTTAWRILNPRRLGQAAWRLRPITAVVVVLIVAAPWFVLVGVRTGGVWLEQFFIDQNVKRAVATFDRHSGPFYYYIVAVLIGLFPWSVFLGPTLIHTTRRFRQSDPRRAGYLLAVCWLVVYLVFWSLVQTKLPHYILPAFPALALLTGALLHHWLASPESAHRGWLLNATATWIVVGIAMLVVVPLVAAAVLPGEGWLGIVGLVLVVGGLGCLAFGLRGRTDLLVRGFAVTSIAFVIAIMGFAAQRVDQHQNAPALLAEIRRKGRCRL